MARLELRWAMSKGERSDAAKGARTRWIALLNLGTVVARAVAQETDTNATLASGRELKRGHSMRSSGSCHAGGRRERPLGSHESWAP
jgi:hypothetical protein